MPKHILKLATADESDLSSFPEMLKKYFTDTRSEILIVFILAIAGVATSWSGYQAALWSGIQSARYSEATYARVESSRASNEAGQLAIADVDIFIEWLNARELGRTELEQIYRTRFRPEFVPAFEAWLESDPWKNKKAFRTPFAQPEYHLQFNSKAEEFTETSIKLFKEGQDANETSDKYVMNTVILAMVMFLCSMAQQFKGIIPRIIMLILSTTMTGIVIFNLTHYAVAG